jgi:tRNA(Arg) A34 adenosine deaminase TadA
MPISAQDREHLRHAVDLAEEALEAGDEPFGSVLVDGAGVVLQSARNEVVHRNETHHPELTLAQWAGDHLDAAGRAAATVYTSGEHCPMCSAGHAWVGLGRIVYASSAEQTSRWVAELGAPASPVLPLPVGSVAPGVPTDGPDEELGARVRELHRRFHEGPAAV